MISHLEQDTLLRYLRDAPAVLAQSHYNIISHPDAILALHRDKRMAIVSPIGLAIIGRLASLPNAERAMRLAKASTNPYAMIADVLQISEDAVRDIAAISATLLTAECVEEALESHYIGHYVRVLKHQMTF